jgi:hypothetical protein
VRTQLGNGVTVKDVVSPAVQYRYIQSMVFLYCRIIGMLVLMQTTCSYGKLKQVRADHETIEVLSFHPTGRKQRRYFFKPRRKRPSKSLAIGTRHVLSESVTSLRRFEYRLLSTSPLGRRRHERKQSRTQILVTSYDHRLAPIAFRLDTPHLMQRCNHRQVCRHISYKILMRSRTQT